MLLTSPPPRMPPQGSDEGRRSLTSGQLGCSNQFPITMAAALLMTVPVAIVFIIFQKRFVAGANEGGVKG